MINKYAAVFSNYLHILLFFNKLKLDFDPEMKVNKNNKSLYTDNLNLTAQTEINLFLLWIQKRFFTENIYPNWAKAFPMNGLK